jgi:invasion protein IalB
MKVYLNVHKCLLQKPKGQNHSLLGLLMLAAGSLALALAPTVAAAQAVPSTLPGGAEAISEVFQDWTVSCLSPEGGKSCSIRQQQADAKTRQRLLAVQLQSKGDKVEGLMVLPFGLLIDKGVTLKVGETSLGTLRFKTCLPQGCLVPFSLNAQSLSLLRAGSAPLSIIASNDANQPLTFNVSVKGFSQALDRAQSLAK